MRSLLLALVALAVLASPASAAVIEIEDHFCGCDGSSGDEDTRGLVVRAAPGELNHMSIRRSPRGVVIEDLGAPLTGACRPASSGGRFCSGEFDGVTVELGDGDDEIVVAGPPALLTGGAGADRIDASLAPGSTVSYLGHTNGVTVRLNGLADDGAVGEGDNVFGAIASILGGSGDDVLEAGANRTTLAGERGDDTLLGGPENDFMVAGTGDDELIAGDGDDQLIGGEGADVLGGGPGRDEVSYISARDPLRLTIGDGPGDGADGEGDDIWADVEDLVGGSGSDLLVGDEDSNRLVASGGRDRLFGLGGADRLEGWDDGDELVPGPGSDLVLSGATDRPLLADGEADRTECGGRAPVIDADLLDTFGRCAPRLVLSLLRPLRRGVPARMAARCVAPSAVPCAGRVLLHRLGGRNVSRAVRVRPIAPGRRRVVRLRFRARLPSMTCLEAVATTRRRDGARSTTTWRSVLGCVSR
jgi:hypothetical protein